MIRINDLYPSIISDGRLSGMPAVVIRLQGCNVGCHWCDAKDTWRVDESKRDNSWRGPNPRWTYEDPVKIAQLARNAGPRIKLALITGGEPAEQDLRELTRALRAEHFACVLETSGTATGFQGSNWEWFILSPKFGMPGKKSVLLPAIEQAKEFKLVIGNESSLRLAIQWLRQVEAFSDSYPNHFVSLQPLSGNKNATKLCRDACLEHGWNLSLQTDLLLAR